jgi:hypothetical protein
MRSARNIAVSLVALVALVGIARAEEAELAWDQEKVAKVAAEFAAAADRLYNEARVESYAEDSLQSADIWLVVEDLKSIKRYGGQLARRLDSGEGREDTTRLFERLQMLVRDARVHKRQAPVLEGEAAQAEIAKARKILAQLNAYYGMGEASPDAPAAPGN